MAARLTSFSMETGVPRTSASSASRVRECQPGRCGAYRSWPVCGSMAPGVPITVAVMSPWPSPASRRAPSKASATSWAVRLRTSSATATASMRQRPRSAPAMSATTAVIPVGSRRRPRCGRRRGGSRTARRSDRAAGLAARGAHQAHRFQSAEQLGGGGLGQAGQLSDPGAGQWAVRDEEVEGRAVVHGAQDARGAGGSRGRTGHDLSPRSTVRKVSYWVRGT